MSDSAYYVQAVVQNLSESETAVAVATDWLGDCVSDVDIVQANGDVSGESEVTVQFILRLSEEDVERVGESERFRLLGEA